MQTIEKASKEKRLGAYYTPFSLAYAIVKLFDFKQGDSILEPSCGSGSFLDALKAQQHLDYLSHVDAIEIDGKEAQKVAYKYRNYSNIKVLNADFFDFYTQHKEAKYSYILGNPPYIRYQYLTKPQRNLLSEILQEHSLKGNKLINTYVAFCVACASMLADKGRLVFILPAEILQVTYAKDLRQYLASVFSKITIITFKKLVFPAISEEIVIFIGEKGDLSCAIKVIEMQDTQDLESFCLKDVIYESLDSTRSKWTEYFLDAKEHELLLTLQQDSRLCRFGDLALVNVGITTGNNDYFSVTEDTCRLYSLESVTKPLIGRSSHAHGIFFAENDFRQNAQQGRRARLICFPDNIAFDDYPDLHKRYITLGEEAKVHTGYKCSIRDRWYIVPSIWLADAFFLRRSHRYPRLTLNCCNAVSTDTMHRIKLYDKVKAQDLLLGYYNSIAFAFLKISGRSYGGGVLEILPKELSDLFLVDVKKAKLTDEFKDELLQTLDQKIRDNNDIESVLDLVDTMVLVKALGFDPHTCKRCRSIWRKLQGRRLTRSKS